MSQLLIGQYLNRLDRLRKITGANRETQVREAFRRLLEDWGESKKLTFVSEYEFIGPAKQRNRVDGVLLQSLRVPFGWWEAKDTGDDLDEEIGKKLRRGYPQDNIIFEDTRTAVLWQNRQETMRCPIDDTAALATLLGLFFSHEPAPTRDFRKAVEQFKRDLPAVLGALRDMIDEAQADNTAFAGAAEAFLKQAKETINPAITTADIREMLIQHILTEEVFANVFGNADFHRENNVAKALYGLEATFFKGDRKFQTLKQLEPYYAAIRSTAAQIGSHSEKQAFLKVIYENFYKVYNAKAADRLGVVYTPNEIVRFMVESADWLCEKHFGKNLIDRDVEILDPATGTGTFIVELLQHFRGQPEKLKYKYKNELYANEVAILPYYVANLNIEATYAALTGEYAEFPNLCFVDTLDNVAALKAHKGHQADMFGAISDENIARVKRQNERRISVIIGNPPYNANQRNENDNNKNREYREVDARIRGTYVENRSSHKTKTYDMYVRFVRWATDRLGDHGIVAFVVNRSFIDKRAFDGFRKTVTAEFIDVYVVDLGGDSRDEASVGGNVFGNRIGIAILFLVMLPKSSHHTVSLTEVTSGSAREKLLRLNGTNLSDLPLRQVARPAAGEWGSESEGGFWDFLPLTPPKLSGEKLADSKQCLFELASFGCVSNRDDWVYDHNFEALINKVRFYFDVYNETAARLPRERILDVAEFLDYRIKWTQDLRTYLMNRKPLRFQEAAITCALYRPFSKRHFYFSSAANWSLYQMPRIFPNGEGGNKALFFSDRGARAPFSVLGADRVAELHLCASTDGFQSVSRYRYTKDGARLDNITDWALGQFRAHYGGGSPHGGGTGDHSPLAEEGGPAKPGRMRAAAPTPHPVTLPRDSTSPARGEAGAAITKDDIFAYVYAVLHDPVYRETYALNLKREFPRIPFYKGFRRWRDWGQTLLDLHIGYEAVEPFDLKRIDVRDERAAKAGLKPKPILKADREAGIITLDSETQLSGVPALAWTYRLGNRSAIDWVLDQHKEKTPKDPTVRARFNTYRFADHKERVIDLLRRVTTVSVRTQEIVEAMRAADR